MGTRGLGQTARDSILKELEFLVVFPIETLLLDEFPQTFDEIEIGRVWRDKQDFNVQTSSDI
ncbi:MAG TPA: hypothetical protein VN207_05395 [Ktedonobacteraceae bacterium]|nr:hypothetical protein [Ktedonobacteraceae bacterium]